ncbi:DoxX family protein [Staphylococcus saprophyticus]|uniref:DoxX family protein n=1 Tax=Staphylococcus saprophyticus TaxID=29385 RepID=UPI0034DD4E77
MRIGLLLIRLMLGITFTIHGAQKVFGGFKEPMAMISDLGFPAFFGVILGLFEFIGGSLAPMVVGLTFRKSRTLPGNQRPKRVSFFMLKKLNFQFEELKKLK